jgi:hypothetical protein
MHVFVPVMFRGKSMGDWNPLRQALVSSTVAGGLLQSRHLFVVVEYGNHGLKFSQFVGHPGCVQSERNTRLTNNNDTKASEDK